MINDSSSDLEYYVDFFQLNRKLKIIWRTCDDGKFLVEVEVNAGLKWWLREARGFHMKIRWS